MKDESRKLVFSNDYFKNDFHLIPDACPVKFYAYSSGCYYLEGFIILALSIRRIVNQVMQNSF